MLIPAGMLNRGESRVIDPLLPLRAGRGYPTDDQCGRDEPTPKHGRTFVPRADGNCPVSEPSYLVCLDPGAHLSIHTV
jgi:hypothetical protein